MQILKLIDGATGNITGEPFKLERGRQIMSGNMLVQIYGIGSATVQLQGTISDDLAVRDGTAIWSPIANGTYTADICDSLFVPFPYIRVVITGYDLEIGGAITVTISGCRK